MGNHKNKWKPINHQLCESINISKWLPNVKSPKRSLDAMSIGEDEQDETFSGEVKKEDPEVVATKKWRREHKREYQWKYKLQQARFEEELQQRIEDRSFLQHIDHALSILISDVARKAHVGPL